MVAKARIHLPPPIQMKRPLSATVTIGKCGVIYFCFTKMRFKLRWEATYEVLLLQYVDLLLLCISCTRPHKKKPWIFSAYFFPYFHSLLWNDSFLLFYREFKPFKSIELRRCLFDCGFLLRLVTVLFWFLTRLMIRFSI